MPSTSRSGKEDFAGGGSAIVVLASQRT